MGQIYERYFQAFQESSRPPRDAALLAYKRGLLYLKCDHGIRCDRGIRHNSAQDWY